MDFKIIDLVNQISLQEMTLDKIVQIGGGEDVYYKFMVSKIISDRMFLYFNEKIMRKQQLKNPQQIYYEYLSSILNNKSTHFRDLVVFEIISLMEKVNINYDVKEIEEMFLVDLHENILTAFKHVLKREQNISVSLKDNKKEINEIIEDLNFQNCDEKYRIKFFLGVLLHVENFDMDLEIIYENIFFSNESESIKNDLKRKFNNFLDIVIGKYYMYDRPEYFVSLLLMAIKKDYKLFKNYNNIYKI